MAKYTKILAPVDGSKFAENAFNEAVEIAKRNDASLHIIYAVNDFAAYQNLGSFDTLYTELHDQAQQLVDDYAKEAEDAGVKEVVAKVLSGDPRNEIVNYQEKENCDLVVVGSSGKSGFQRVLVGSVCEYVVMHSHADVLVMR